MRVNYVHMYPQANNNALPVQPLARSAVSQGGCLRRACEGGYCRGGGGLGGGSAAGADVGRQHGSMAPRLVRTWPSSGWPPSAAAGPAGPGGDPPLGDGGGGEWAAAAAATSAAAPVAAAASAAATATKTAAAGGAAPAAAAPAVGGCPPPTPAPPPPMAVGGWDGRGRRALSALGVDTSEQLPPIRASVLASLQTSGLVAPHEMELPCI